MEWKNISILEGIDMMLRTEALERVTEKTSMGNRRATWKLELWYDAHDIGCALFLSQTLIPLQYQFLSMLSGLWFIEGKY